MCDLAYSIQAEQIEREALAQLALAPHVKEGTQLDTPETAVAAFDKWLREPPVQDRRPEDTELIDLIRGR